MLLQCVLLMMIKHKSLSSSNLKQQRDTTFVLSNRKELKSYVSHCWPGYGEEALSNVLGAASWVPQEVDSETKSCG